MKLIYFFLLIFVSTIAYAQAPVLTEDFNYPAGDALTAHAWSAHSAAGTNPILVTSPGLTFAGYVGSNIGLAAGINNTGEDVNKSFGEQTTGSVYASFLVNVPATSALATGSYFFHFVDASVSSAHRARTFLFPPDANGKFPINFTFNAATGVTASSYLLNSGQTYLFVAKYKIVDGATNDSVSLYVFKEGDNFISEPSNATFGPLAGTAADIAPAGIALRQFDANQRITVDGFRVKTKWQLTQDDASAINQINGNKPVNFYPNPVTGGCINLVGLSNSTKQVEIFDIVGNKVFDENTMLNKLDISPIKAGMYLLKVNAANQIYSSKLIIK
jgi:hypothetical protein